MLAALFNAFRVPELRTKLFYTAIILFVYRVGSYIPVPGVDAAAILAEFNSLTGSGGVGILSLLNLFSGGALSRFTIFALNIGPYITASIVVQLLGYVIPSLEKLQKEGVEGRKQLAKYTTYLSIFLAFIQSYTYVALLSNAITGGILQKLLIMISMTAGASFCVWLGGLISQNGIGNGVSLLIFAGIVAGIPSGLVNGVALIAGGGVNILAVILLLLIGLAIIVATVAIELGQRKIPVQYPKRVVGRRVYGGQSTHIPLKVNQAGVIPVIFASSILAFVTTIGQYIPAVSGFFSSSLYTNWVYNSLYLILIILFTFFYTGLTFNPVDVADNMKKAGGFVPGIRPGKPTSDYLSKISTRLTFCGAIFLAALAIAPNITTVITPLNIGLGGTSLLIVIGVALDTVRQIESQLVMRQYEGFMK